jgi:hypothetical protein
MMQAWLAALVAVQDGDVSFSARTRKSGAEIELTVTASGRGLADGMEARIRFHKLLRRFDWEQGRFVVTAEEEAPLRSARVNEGRLEFTERFPAPALVEGRLEMDGRLWRRVWRVGGAVESAGSVRAASRRMEQALRMLRSAIEDADVLGGPEELSARRARDLKRRLDWRFGTLREEFSTSPFTAAAEAGRGLIADLEAALELTGSGRPIEGLLSNLGGLPFTWAGARELAGKLEALALQERMLVALDQQESLRASALEAARSGQAAAWSRFEKAARRALEETGSMLAEAASASGLEQIRSSEAARLADLQAGLFDLLGRGADAIACMGGSADEVETLAEALRIEIERTQKRLETL